VTWRGIDPNQLLDLTPNLRAATGFVIAFFLDRYGTPGGFGFIAGGMLVVISAFGPAVTRRPLEAIATWPRRAGRVDPAPIRHHKPLAQTPQLARSVDVFSASHAEHDLRRRAR